MPREIVLGGARGELVEFKLQLPEQSLLALRAPPVECVPELLDHQRQGGDLGGDEAAFRAAVEAAFVAAGFEATVAAGYADRAVEPHMRYVRGTDDDGLRTGAVDPGGGLRALVQERRRSGTGPRHDGDRHGTMAGPP